MIRISVARRVASASSETEDLLPAESVIVMPCKTPSKIRAARGRAVEGMLISIRRSTRPLITHNARSAVINRPKAACDHGSTAPNARAQPAITAINPSAIIELSDGEKERRRERATERKSDGETKKPRRCFFPLCLFPPVSPSPRLPVSPSLRLSFSPSFLLSIPLSLCLSIPMSSALDKREVVKPNRPSCWVVVTEPGGSHDGQSRRRLIGGRDKT